MDARRVGILEGLAGAVDVLVQGAGQATDGAVLDGPGHGLHRFEIAHAGDGEARLDDVHPHALQGLGDTHLLVLGHGGARALLAVAQGGIEND